MLNRASMIYLAMIVVLVGGLWAVLAVGGRLTAPEDLGGLWTPAGPATWTGLTVEQSGRYFELAFDGVPRFGVTADSAGDGGRLALSRGPWSVTIDAETAGQPGVRTFRVSGPATGTFTGRRATAAAASTGPATREAR